MVMCPRDFPHFVNSIAIRPTHSRAAKACQKSPIAFAASATGNRPVEQYPAALTLCDVNLWMLHMRDLVSTATRIAVSCKIIYAFFAITSVPAIEMLNCDRFAASHDPNESFVARVLWKLQYCMSENWGLTGRVLAELVWAYAVILPIVAIVSMFLAYVISLAPLGESRFQFAMEDDQNSVHSESNIALQYYRYVREKFFAVLNSNIALFGVFSIVFQMSIYCSPCGALDILYSQHEATISSEKCFSSTRPMLENSCVYFVILVIFCAIDAFLLKDRALISRLDSREKKKS